VLVEEGLLMGEREEGEVGGIRAGGGGVETNVWLRGGGGMKGKRVKELRRKEGGGSWRGGV